MSKAASTAPPISKNRALPAREALSFKSVLQAYETRQWKRGLKTADQILKKYPDHGETLSMKGLILTNLNRKEEGIELVRKGLRMDLTSHICWHVLGLVHKADRNYAEALKCYTQALKFEKDNLNILRDAAHMQTQLRHFDQLVETRQTLLKYRANLRQSWIALALAYHLNGKLDFAKKVLEQYEATVKDVPPRDPEHSELLLYHVRILEEMKRHDEALDFLVKNVVSQSIIDKSTTAILKARLLHKLGKTDETREAWLSIIDSNPESYDHYRRYLLTQGIDMDSLENDSRTAAIKVLHQLSARIPRAIAPRRILLKLTSGDEFRLLVATYFEAAIARGIPSLFSDLKDLYVSSEKRQVIEDIAEDLYRKTLENSKEYPPSSHIWVLYYLIQHHATNPSTIPRALALADKAIEHSPALPDLYMAKARALKRAGNPFEACITMASAWRLDLQDRFLNTKNAKYLLRAGYIEEAIKMLGLFTKKTASLPGADLEEMQSLFYMREAGDAQHRSGKLNLALKRYNVLFKTFDDIEDDQYDFHAYALRKFTMTTYLLLIEMEDNLRSHPAYAPAALAAAKIYVQIHDETKPAPQTSALDSKKRAGRRGKNVEIKPQEDSKKALATPPKTDDTDIPVVRDDDPEGLKLLTVPDPLEIAWKRLLPLHSLRPKLLDTWLVSFDVAIRQKKYLQALKALNHARNLSPGDPGVHYRLIEFKLAVEQPNLKLPAPVQTVITEELLQIFPADVSLETFNSAFMQTNVSPGSTLGAAQALVLIRGQQSSQVEAEELTFQLLRPETHLSIQTGLDALEFLRTTLKSPRHEEFRLQCALRFPLSCVFKTREELDELRESTLKHLAALEELEGEKDEILDVTTN
ncbi:NMDA receptor-regulated protein 1a [Cantharellus anzutake]|uniref:NMDA receptor-regulated protein 1a n=1 Tax=Cantharellus anzutake TaxID=1750568 RepID=UPI0019050475|nr:NMDA receptor-regulated protein 1a [Cantharellus anzutake]KAF8328455.1 NMDA receptor-regulated protein 1a [Cantharellus anzutake]